MGVHVKGDSPMSIRLGEDIEFWVRTYAVENQMPVNQVIKAAIREFAGTVADKCSAKLD